MIKSDFGRIEVNGEEPVIMAEFETLLVALRRVLGDKKYNLVLQEASNKKLTEKGRKRTLGRSSIKAILSKKEDK